MPARSGDQRFEKIRRLVITAIFSDDWLLQRVVLKGGNALNLVHHIGSRTSIDIDLSVPPGVVQIEEMERRLERALVERFGLAGYYLFDFDFEARGHERLAGCELRFKLIPETRRDQLGRDVEAMRREATVIAPGQLRNFRVQISLGEYCDAKAEAELDGFLLFVYTPAMIAIEKVRAICQQMPEYPHRPHPAPRARDFYDIWAIELETSLDIADPGHRWLFREVFGAKAVPLELIGRIPETREFHSADWPSVVQSVGSSLAGFDHYFDHLCGKLASLQPLWVE